jgi:hypothetical protein
MFAGAAEFLGRTPPPTFSVDLSWRWTVCAREGARRRPDPALLASEAVRDGGRDEQPF